MPADPSAWTCTCAAAVPLALGLHHRQQTEGHPPGSANAVLQALSGSHHEASYAFLLEAILHEATDQQAPPLIGVDHTHAAIPGAVADQDARQDLLSGLYTACALRECQECLQQLLCTPDETIVGVCLEVSRL